MGAVPLLSGDHAFHLMQHREEGPAILWYGWLAVAAIMSAVDCVRRASPHGRTLPNEVVWGVQLALVIIMFIYEKQWFF